MLWIAATAAAAGFVSGLCYYSIAPVVLLAVLSVLVSLGMNTFAGARLLPALGQAFLVSLAVQVGFVVATLTRASGPRQMATAGFRKQWARMLKGRNIEPGA